MIQFMRILLSALLVGPFYAVLPLKTAQRAVNTSVLLRMKSFEKNKRRNYGGCSGTYIAPTIILTAAHCFSNESVEFVWAKGVNDQFGYPVHLIRISTAKDLALLEAPFNHPYAKLGRMPEVSEEVLNVGSPFNFEFVVSAGIIAAVGYHSSGFTSHYLVTTAMINPGSSGGGAFNSKGELVGVNTMMIGMFGWAGISLAVSVDDVREFVRYL